jgi:hypothetical protein
LGIVCWGVNPNFALGMMSAIGKHYSRYVFGNGIGLRKGYTKTAQKKEAQTNKVFHL